MDVTEIPRLLEPDRNYWRHRGNRQVRKARWTRGLWRWSGTIAIHGGILAVLLFLGIGAARHVINTRGLSVREIEIVGAKRSSAEALRESLRPFRGAGLAGLDLEAISAAIENDPWVARSSVKRVFPGTLRVAIVEREPAALAVIDGFVQVIDASGRVIGPSGADLADDLPVLTGLEGLEGEHLSRALTRGVEALVRVAAVSPGWASNVSELDLSRPDRISIATAGHGPRVLLDPAGAERNLDDYLALRTAIRRRIGSAEYIDLRWRDRITVMPAAGPGNSETD